MGERAQHLKSELAALGEDDLGKRDAWMFAPLVMVVAILPIAIVAIVSASLYFAANSADRYGGSSFASRFENVYTRVSSARPRGSDYAIRSRIARTAAHSPWRRARR